ncbi:hypothetical protein JD77_05504 [Micromonospora olivasterospora]|uniref:Uncharacterized protein n=1 Tax=Micromonospora olivasterospora TaxID=1880 RepID=A0A562IHI6_MICOL|nr:hypothetical protein JD77_05504 [Micromonospora olivasterospora]
MDEAVADRDDELGVGPGVDRRGGRDAGEVGQVGRPGEVAVRPAPDERVAEHGAHRVGGGDVEVDEEVPAGRRERVVGRRGAERDHQGPGHAEVHRGEVAHGLAAAAARTEVVEDGGAQGVGRRGRRLGGRAGAVARTRAARSAQYTEGLSKPLPERYRWG